MKKFLGILLLTQIMVGFSWGMEDDSFKKEAVFKLIMSRVIEENPELSKAESVASISWDGSRSNDRKGILVVNIIPTGTFDIELFKTDAGFRIGEWSVVWDVLAGTINWLETTAITAATAPTPVTRDTEEETSASVSAAATAPSEPKETSPADAARAREAELRAQGASDASVVLKREGRRIEKEISNAFKRLFG
jgi:hypothetical protein